MCLLGFLTYQLPAINATSFTSQIGTNIETHSMKFAHSFQTLSESTHSQLKKNVYQNYRQFIDTAKEIGFLEKEMYQLSHMITDQRNLLLGTIHVLRK